MKIKTMSCFAVLKSLIINRTSNPLHTRAGFLLLAVLLIGARPAVAADLDVDWMNAVEVAVNGNSITKTTTTSGYWVSGASSVASFNGNLAVDFAVPQTTADLMCGLAAADPDQNYTSIDYAISLTSGGVVQVYQKGTLMGSFGSYVPWDRFQVQRVGFVIYYKKNGTTFYTSTVPSSGKLMVDTAIYSAGGVIADVTITGITLGVSDSVSDLSGISPAGGSVMLLWTPPANNGTAITGHQIQYGTVASGTFGSVYVDDGSAGATITGLTNGTAYQFRIVAINSYGVSGLSNVVNVTPYTPQDVAWTNMVNVSASGNTMTKTCCYDGVWDASGSSVATFGGSGGAEFTANTALWLISGLVSTDVQAITQNTINYGVSFYYQSFAIVENGVTKYSSAILQDGDRFRIERIGTTVYYRKNGFTFYTSTVPSSGTLKFTGVIAKVGNAVSDARTIGFATGAPEAITTLKAIPWQSGEVKLDWIMPGNGGTAITGYQVQYGTVASGAFASTFNDDATPGATITGLTNGTAYQFLVVAANSSGTSAASNVVVETPNLPTNVIWNNVVGSTASGNSLTKTAATGWGNSGGSSVQSFSGNGAVDFTVTQTTDYEMFGLSSADTDQNYTTNNYALLANGGTVYVYENGTSRGAYGGYAIGDRFRVERTGTTVYYRKNGTLLYTSGIASSGKLLADGAIYSNGGVISDAKILGLTLKAPDAVNDLSAMAATSAGTAQLSWSAPANNGGTITGYQVQYGTLASGSFASTFNDDATPGASVTGLTDGTPYQFRVVATNAYGTSSVSNVVVVTPRAPINVVWTNIVGVSASGNSITKTAASGWGNGGASSIATIGGSGGVDFTVTQTNVNVMLGLSATDANQNYTSINYALYPAAGVIYILENGTQIGSTYGTYAAGDRFRVERVGPTIYYKKNGVTLYTSTVPSTGVLLADSALYSNGGVISDAKIVGVTAGAPDAIIDFNGQSNASGQVTFTWSTPGNNGASITSYQIQYGTVASGAYASVFNDDATPGATITGLTNGTAYQFRVVAINSNGTSAASNSVTVVPNTPVNVVWTNTSGVSVSSNSITKTSSVGWGNSGGASTATFAGDGGIDFKMTQSGTHAMLGLSTSDPNTNYMSINYAFYAAAGTIQVYENGTPRGSFGPYAVNDRLRVERLGTTIFYKKNGITFYTSAVPSTGILMADAAIYTNGGVLSDARMIGFTGGPPNAITDLSISAGNNPGEVALNWSAPANNGAAVTMYQVQYGTVASGAFGSTYNDDAVPGATITGLTNGTAYQFRVVAINSFGASASSNVQSTSPVQRTVISGNITSNTTWTTAGSPYQINANVTINSGSTLTINPGVTVQFMGNFYLTATGTLSAQGTVGSPILFTSGKSVVAPGDWQYLALSAASVIDYTQIEYADKAVKIDNASPSVSHSVIRYNNYGVYLSSASTSSITYNKLVRNNYGVYVYPSTGFTMNPTINYNDIFDNTTNNVYASGHQNFSAITINAENNWWGTTNTTTIAAKIYDQADNANSPLVDASPYLTGSDTISITGNSVSSKFFDPLTTTSTIYYTLDKPADVTIRVYQDSPNQLVRTLILSQSRSSGANSQVWDGKNDSAVAVPDGNYYYTITAQDSSSRFGQYDPLYVPGSVTIQNPSVAMPFSDLNYYRGDIADIGFEITQPALVTVKVGLGNHVTAERVLMNKKGWGALAPVTTTFEGLGDAGNVLPSSAVAGLYYVYAWAELAKDNGFVISRAPTTPRITSVRNNPYAFAPLYNEGTSVAYAITGTEYVTVRVKDPAGNVIRVLENNVQKSPGTYNVIWYGTTASDKKVNTAGTYMVEVETNNGAGSVVTKMSPVTVFK